MRTLSEIYDAICAEKANMSQLNDWYTDQSNPGSILDDHQTLLQDLTSSSKVAIWRLIIWIVAVAIWIHEGLWEVFRAEIDAAIDKGIAHTARWYQEQSLLFQYGDELIWNDSKRRFDYENYDENKQIIKQAAVTEAAGYINLKVATETSGELTKLSDIQLAAFTEFWQKFKDAGVHINIINENADLLKISYDIYYDPLLLNSNGEMIKDGTKPVETAINNYIHSLGFDGRFKLESCDAAIRSAAGVIDFKRNFILYKYGAYDYKAIEMSRIAFAGYYKIDPDNQLTDTINYIANV